MAGTTGFSFVPLYDGLGGAPPGWLATALTAAQSPLIPVGSAGMHARVQVSLDTDDVIAVLAYPRPAGAGTPTTLVAFNGTTILAGDAQEFDVMMPPNTSFRVIALANAVCRQLVIGAIVGGR